VKDNNAYFANCIQINGTTEIPNQSKSNENCVKGVILDVKSAPTGDLPSINKFIDNITKSFEYENVSVIFGIRFEDTLTGKEVTATVIELIEDIKKIDEIKNKYPKICKGE
jgi:hypothetical protein